MNGVCQKGSSMHLLLAAAASAAAWQNSVSVPHLLLCLKRTAGWMSETMQLMVTYYMILK